MYKALIFTGLTALGAVTIAAGGARQPTALEATPWNVDAPHTEINFSVRHFFTPVSGRFEDFEIDLAFDPESPGNSSVEVRIGVASINTGNERRDNHLRSGDWFEAESYPYITFKSSSVTQTAADRLLARGELTIKDVTQEVELPITLLGVQEIPEQMREMLGGVTQVASFQAETELDRRDYGVGTGNWAMTAVVGADVEVEIVVEANQK
ncbi:MAG: polyisoprenoid-binding protein [Gemmatimonadetes bacterium]|nr:polyisoprenoid-binding protein [Gemmatimonadota bacterium]NIO30524.1 polyisoprenoid-binding protein [Gemmatimonadota bacterium]